MSEPSDRSSSTPPPSHGAGFAPFLAALKLRGLKCLIVGEGAELTARIQTLLETDAKLHVLSISPEADVQALADQGRIRLESRPFEPSDLDGVWFAVLTTRDAQLGRAMGNAARVRRVFFCAVDEPSVGTFSHMAVASAPPLRVAISTAGQAPALAARFRAELERLFAESNVEAMVARLAELRAATPAERRAQVLIDAAALIRFTGAIADDHENAGE